MLLLLLAPALLCCDSLFAQPSFGIYGGLARSSLQGDAPRNGIYVPGTHLLFGLIGDFRIADDVKLSLQPALYTSGGEINFLDSATSEYLDSITVTLRYVGLPVLFKVISDNQRFQFLGGLDLAYAFEITGNDGASEMDLSGEVGEWNTSIIFGVGYIIQTGGSNLFVEIRYRQGLVNLTNDLADFTNPVPRAKTTSLRFLVGWMLPSSN